MYVVNLHFCQKKTLVKYVCREYFIIYFICLLFVCYLFCLVLLFFLNRFYLIQLICRIGRTKIRFFSVNLFVVPWERLIVFIYLTFVVFCLIFPPNRHWHVLRWRTFYTIYMIGIGTWWITKVVCCFCFFFSFTLSKLLISCKVQTLRIGLNRNLVYWTLYQYGPES